jgi:hypothetical protein
VSLHLDRVLRGGIWILRSRSHSAAAVHSTVNMWERRAPLTPPHCARLLLGGGKGSTGVHRIVVQPSTDRIHHDSQYEDAGCEVSEDLSGCGLIVGIKQPKVTFLISYILDSAL